MGISTGFAESNLHRWLEESGFKEIEFRSTFHRRAGNPRSPMKLQRWLRILLAAQMICAVASIERAAAKDRTSIVVGGGPVEIKISEVSGNTIRIELAPLDEPANSQTAAPSPALVDFSSKEKFRARRLAGETKIRAGNFRVTLRSQPPHFQTILAGGEK